MKTWAEIEPELRVRDLLDLAKELAKRFNVPPKDMFGPSMGTPEVAARHEFIGQVWDRGHWSLAALGRLLDMDHTSIRHALVRVGRKPPERKGG